VRPEDYVKPEQITEEEARGFLRAVDAGVFEIGRYGHCYPRGMRPSISSPPGFLDWFDKRGGKVMVWREWLTHAATPLMLHEEYGYPLHDIALEVDGGAFDVLVYSAFNQPFIAVEVKKRVKELDVLISNLHALEGKPFEVTFTKRLTNAEQKFRGLLSLRPVYFLGVAPTVPPRAFKVSYPSDPATQTAELVEIDNIPTAEEARTSAP
jgi:hypothetical protein